MKFVGIDGCRAGWFLLGLNDDGAGNFRLLKHIVELDAYLDAVEVVLIDVPIGLRGRHPEERVCDKQARAVLRPNRGSCVFPAPSRCALQCETYEEASKRNKECTGRGLSKQSFAIMPKIREVDQYLADVRRRPKVHEMHPEVCFWALNGQKPMQYNKKKKEGYAERIAILIKHDSQARDWIEMAMRAYARAEVARDDIVDALVGAIIARNTQSLRRFPDNPEKDEVGLPMEIVY